MKITKMSLVAALLVGSSAFAIDNVKVSGDAKLYYATDDAAGTSQLGATKSASLFDAANSTGQAAASLSISADLTEGISAGSKVTALTTLGLQNSLVSNVWELTTGVSDSFIVNDLWLAATAGKTTAKIGRMELDTPLVFSEKWSITANTYEAAVLINQDIPDTTLVGAYVGASNIASANGYGGVIAAEVANTTFSQFGPSGAFAVGAINNSWAPLTAQAWYYNVRQTASAYWLQADLNIEGILVGAQYTGLSPEATGAKDGDAYAVMIGYEMKDVLTAKVAYSATNEDVGAGGNVGGTQSKLYTEAWWNYGQITQNDTTAINVTVEGTVSEIDLGAYFTMVDHGDLTSTGNGDLTELTLAISKSFGPLDTSLVYIYADEAENTATIDPDAVNTVQAYLTYNF